ncbi:hypothetical protein [Limosilactobacillus reuteri]|uniref:DUF541 domain-containing protein n=1 Tax=Limosilactobacillus reuteri TaxID=1598 RepID=A0ABD6Y672_LIMRT|nr:hypothetical protein [Limosilactobacillus reuteri]PWT37204.1 hypothetical protein DKZ35_06455 [Limosilactobacillus reuteri]
MASTHVLNIKIGFDLTEILSPKNIPGVKAYLGVKSDNELASAIFQDKFNQIGKLLSQNGFNIINAEVQEVAKSYRKQKEDTLDMRPTKSTAKASDEVENDDKKLASSIDNNTQEKEHQSSRVKDASNDKSLYRKKQDLFKKLKTEFEKIRKAKGNIEVIKYNSTAISFAPSPVELQHEANISEDVIIDVEEIDKGVLAIISYIDKDQKMQTSIVKEEN